VNGTTEPADENSIPGFESVKNGCLSVALRKVNSRSLLLVMKGRVDADNSRQFKERVTQAIEAGFSNLIFDCRDVEYVSSTGMATFMQLNKSIRPMGGRIIMVAASQKVMEVFHLVGFETFLDFVGTVGEAEEKIGAPGAPSPFPKIIACPGCVKRLRVAKAGRFRCVDCGTIITVDAAASVSRG